MATLGELMVSIVSRRRPVLAAGEARAANSQLSFALHSCDVVPILNDNIIESTDITVLPAMVTKCDSCGDRGGYEGRKHIGQLHVVQPYRLSPNKRMLKETPAMASGIENHVWTIRELIEESAKF